MTTNNIGDMSTKDKGTRAKACDQPPIDCDKRLDAPEGRTRANACDPPPCIFTTRDSNSCLWPNGHAPAAKIVAFFECPYCNKIEPSTQGNFQLADLDCKQLCSSCRHRTALKLWKCKCNTKWHMCKTHKNALGVYTIPPKVQPSNGQPLIIPRRKGHKRKAIVPNYLMSYEQLLEMEDDKALKKRVLAPPASIVLQQRKTAYKRVPSSFLGPSLIKRFRVARPSANLSA